MITKKEKLIDKIKSIFKTKPPESIVDFKDGIRHRHTAMFIAIVDRGKELALISLDDVMSNGSGVCDYPLNELSEYYLKKVLRTLEKEVPNSIKFIKSLKKNGRSF